MERKRSSGSDEYWKATGRGVDYSPVTGEEEGHFREPRGKDVLHMLLYKKGEGMPGPRHQTKGGSKSGRNSSSRKGPREKASFSKAAPGPEPHFKKGGKTWVVT